MTPGLLRAGAPLVVVVAVVAAASFSSTTSAGPLAAALTSLASPTCSPPAPLRVRSQVGEHHVAEAQPQRLRVKSLDLSGLALQQRANPLQTLVLQGKHFLLDLEKTKQTTKEK